MAIVRVQSNTGVTAAAGTSLANTALGSGATANNLLIASIVIATNGAGSPTTQTPAGYTKVTAGEIVNTNAQGATSCMFYKVAAGAETQVTVQWTGNLNASLELAEYSGLASSSVEETAVTGSQNSAATTAYSVASSGASTVADELFYALVGSSGGITISLPGGGFGIHTNGLASTGGAGGTKSDLSTLSKIARATETPTASGTMSASRALDGIIVGFKTSPTGITSRSIFIEQAVNRGGTY